MVDTAVTRILIADDDPRVASIVATVLEDDGFATEQVFEGVAAVRRALTGEHALVILDWMLPDQSGIECCRQIRAASTIPILMLTGRTGELDVVRGLEVGADDYVMKPFSVPELVGRVRALLRRRELDRAEASRLGADTDPADEVASG